MALWIPDASCHLKNCTQDSQPESVGRLLDVNLEARFLCCVQWPVYSEELELSYLEAECLSSSFLVSPWSVGWKGQLKESPAVRAENGENAFPSRLSAAGWLTWVRLMTSGRIRKTLCADPVNLVQITQGETLTFKDSLIGNMQSKSH